LKITKFGVKTEKDSGQFAEPGEKATPKAS